MALPAILCASLLVGCGAEPPAEEHVRVLAQTVKMAEFASATSITGDIQARVQADQSFRVGGKIVERLVDVGDHVAAGQVLARLDPQDQRSNVENAQAAVAAQQAQSKLADLNYQRQKALLPKGYTSQSEYDQALASVRSAQSSLKAAQAQLANARDLLSYTELRASDAGVITARQAEVGQVVQATVPIFTLARDGERDAVFNVYESLFSHDVDGQRITVSLLGKPEVTASGKVREITPTVDERSGTLKVKVGLDSVPAEMSLGSVVNASVAAPAEHSVVRPAVLHRGRSLRQLRHPLRRTRREVPAQREEPVRPHLLPVQCQSPVRGDGRASAVPGVDDGGVLSRRSLQVGFLASSWTMGGLYRLLARQGEEPPRCCPAQER